MTTHFSSDSDESQHWRQLDNLLAGESPMVGLTSEQATAWTEAFAEERRRERGGRSPAVGDVWERIEQSISTTSRKQRPKPPAWRKMAMGILATAAAATLVIVARPLWQPSLATDEEHEPHTYSTQRAQRAEFRLPDGTFVILAPDTRLLYRGAPRSGTRRVELQGQAYFVVSHVAERPFFVQAGASTTQVLGTSFTVRAYGTDPEASVAVAEGKVEFGTLSATAILTAGDMARTESNTVPTVSHGASIADVLGWTQGNVMFHDAMLKDIVPDLERLFDLEITIADAQLARQRVTVMLAGESADEMLRTITPALEARYARDGKQVTIARKNAGQNR